MEEDDTTNPAVSDAVRVADDAGVEVADDGGVATDPYEPGLPEADELEEFEFQGRTHLAPKALRGAFMMQADYTRKTQELAEQRRTLEAERKALDNRVGQSDDQRRLADLDARLKAFNAHDWDAALAQNPEAAQQAWAEFVKLAHDHQTLTQGVGAREQVEQALEAYEHEMTLRQGYAELTRDIPGWSPELGEALAGYAEKEFGFRADELDSVTDPRLIKLLHRSFASAQSESRNRRLRAAQSTRPATTLKSGRGRTDVAANTDDFSAFEKMADARMHAR